MKNNKYDTLINRLVDSTIKNQICWDKTIRQEEFKAEVSNYSINITRLSQGTFSIAKNNTDKYALSLFNEEGDMIDVIEIFTTDEDYQLAVNLYSEARRSFFKVEDVLDELIECLQ